MEEVFSIYRGMDGLALKLSHYFLLKLREEITYLNELEWIWCWSPFEFCKEVEDKAAPALYIGSNFLLKIPVDSKLMSFERKFNYLQLFQN